MYREMFSELVKAGILKETKAGGKKLPPIQLPVMRFTEKGVGQPGTNDREIFERLMSGVKGRTVEEKVASIKEFIDISETQDVKEILSKLMFIELFALLLNEFNPSTAGFLFEAFLAGLFNGTQIDVPEGGSLPIQDIEILQAAKEFKTGARDDEMIVVPFSLKVLSPGTPVKGSYKNTVDFFIDQYNKGNKNPSIIYLVVVKVEGTGELGQLMFYQFPINKDNWLEWIGAPRITKKKEDVYQYVKGVHKSGTTITTRNIKQIYKGLKSPKSDDPTPIPFELGDVIPKGGEVIKRVKVGEKETEIARQTAVSKKLYGTEQQAADLAQSIGPGTTPIGFFQYLQRTPGYMKNEQWLIASSVYPKKAELIGTLDLSEEKIEKLFDVYTQRLGEGVVKIYNQMAALTKNIQFYFIPEGDKDRRTHGEMAIDNAQTLKDATNEVIDVSPRQQELPLKESKQSLDTLLDEALRQIFN